MTFRKSESDNILTSSNIEPTLALISITLVVLCSMALVLPSTPACMSEMYSSPKPWNIPQAEVLDPTTFHDMDYIALRSFAAEAAI